MGLYGLKCGDFMRQFWRFYESNDTHLFGFYNPKQLADFLDIPHQRFYTELKEWSVYHVKRMLLRFMVKQAAEQLKPVLSKSAATRSRAGMTLSIDNRVMDRFGKLLRCTWNWYSGRYHKVIRGQDLLGIVFTINHIAFPLHLLFCPKQGRYHTNKADLLIFMLTQLKDEFDREGIDITQLPLTMDSAFVSQELRQRLHQLGFTQIIIAGKGNYVFTPLLCFAISGFSVVPSGPISHPHVKGAT